MPACLGLSFLGECAYNPQSPEVVYFSIGEGIAALTFTFAVQNFIRPVYELRMRLRGLTLIKIYSPVFLGSVFVVFGALTPSLPFPTEYVWAYPIVWEVLAGC